MAGEIDRLSQVMASRDEIARGAFGESSARHRCNVQVWHRGLLGQLSHDRGVPVSQIRLTQSPCHFNQCLMRNKLNYGSDALRDGLQHISKPFFGFVEAAEPDQYSRPLAPDPMFDIKPQNLIGVQAQGNVGFEAALLGNRGKRHSARIQGFVQPTSQKERMAEHRINSRKTPHISFVGRQF